MKRSKILIYAGVFILVFFGQIATSFSDQAYPGILKDEDPGFSLLLDNEHSVHASTEFIDREVQRFIQRWGIEGASLAITHDEKLVYAKGFGCANDETEEAVKPGHLFRIASVSKLITATAVMKLYEDGLIDLDEQVFGKQGILNDSAFLHFKDPRLEQVTVRQLLNHSSGWSFRSGDPLFSSAYIAARLGAKGPAALEDVLQYALNRNLRYAPGSRYSYSNLGYAVLGEIIARKSGMPYQDYVLMSILKPIGIHDMHLGGSYYHEKFPNEVKYQSRGRRQTTRDMSGNGKLVPICYGGNNMELLGAAGGWIASAPELLRFLAAVDGFQEQPDILEPSTISMMSDPEIAGKGLFGWRGRDNYGTWWRTGYLSGSSALMVRQGDGISWVLLLNTSTPQESRIHRHVSALMFETVSRVKDWPETDLFSLQNERPEPIAKVPAANPKL